MEQNLFARVRPCLPCMCQTLKTCRDVHKCERKGVLPPLTGFYPVRRHFWTKIGNIADLQALSTPQRDVLRACTVDHLFSGHNPKHFFNKAKCRFQVQETCYY